MVSPDVSLLSDVRALFASKYQAERLREIPLVREFLESLRYDIARDDIGTVVRHAVEAAIESLRPRSRTILARCDLANETHRAVAADLGIGERYFYRERRRALLSFANAMRSQRGVRVPAVAGDAQDALIAAATAMRNAGRFRDADAFLSAAHAAQDSPRLRLALACRLANFAADSNQTALAARWIERGRQDLAKAHDAASELTLAQCELDVVETRMLVAADDFAGAGRRARAIARRLALVGSHPERERLAAALGATYGCLSEAWIMRGSYSDGLTSAIEGYASVRRIGGAPAVEVAALVTIAEARLFASGSLKRASEDLQEAFARAVALGLGRDVATISANLSLVYAALGDRARSAAFSKSALTVARQMFTSRERVRPSFDLVAAALARSDLPCARKIVADTFPHATGLMADVLSLADAEIGLASGNAALALATIRRATGTMERRGDMRFLGTAFRLSAEALAAMGQPSAAATLSNDGLDCLLEAGHPVSLMRAFASSARITGNRKHRARARELLATLQAG